MRKSEPPVEDCEAPSGCVPGTQRCTPAALPALRCRRLSTRAAGAAFKASCWLLCLLPLSAACPVAPSGRLCTARFVAIRRRESGLMCRVSARSASTAHRGTGDDELLHLELLLPKAKWSQLAQRDSALAPRFVRVPHVRQSYEWCADCWFCGLCLCIPDRAHRSFMSPVLLHPWGRHSMSCAEDHAGATLSPT